MWGDPHLDTMDGTSFTFNGIGEFVLLSSSANNLNIQVRMKQYQTFEASVITAVAIKYKQLPVVQLEINSNNQYLLYFNGKDQSDILPTAGNLIVFSIDANAAIFHGQNLSSLDLTNKNNVFLVNVNGTYVMATSTGAVIQIGSELTFLYCVLELGSDFFGNTEGLLGYYDDDPSNDYRLPDGTTLSGSMTEEELYSGFGVKCKLL